MNENRDEPLEPLVYEIDKIIGNKPMGLVNKMERLFGERSNLRIKEKFKTTTWE